MQKQSGKILRPVLVVCALSLIAGVSFLSYKYIQIKKDKGVEGGGIKGVSSNAGDENNLDDLEERANTDYQGLRFYYKKGWSVFKELGIGDEIWWSARLFLDDDAVEFDTDILSDLMIWFMPGDQLEDVLPPSDSDCASQAVVVDHPHFKTYKYYSNCDIDFINYIFTNYVFYDPKGDKTVRIESARKKSEEQETYEIDRFVYLIAPVEGN